MKPHPTSRAEPPGDGARALQTGRAKRGLTIAADALQRSMNVIARVQSVIACLALASIVILLVGSSIQRYALGSPVPIVEELAGLLFVTLAFMAVTAGFTADRQIRVQFVWRALPSRLQGWAMIAGHLLSIVAMAIIVGATWEFASFSYQIGARTDMMEFRLWPWMMLIPASIVILMVATAARALVDLDAVLSGRPVQAALVGQAEERG